jgi:PTS system nitrogen regulatory IIA component
MDAACAVRGPLRLAELFPPEAIRVGLEHRSKTDVIKALVHHAVDLGYIPLHEEQLIVDTLLKREGLASTGLVHGLALPHCQWRSLDRVVGVAGLLQRGIAFDALDGEPVDGIFLTLAPADHPEMYVDVLGRLLAVGRNKSLRLLLRACRTSEQVTAFLHTVDQPADGRLDDLAYMSLSRLDRDRHNPWRDLSYYSLTGDAHDLPGHGDADPRWL